MITATNVGKTTKSTREAPRELTEYALAQVSAGKPSVPPVPYLTVKLETTTISGYSL